MSRINSIQPDFFGGEKIIKGKNQPRNSSFQARCFLQLKTLSDLYIDAQQRSANYIQNDDQQYLKELDFELKKVHMLVKEKEAVLKKKRDEYEKRGK